MHAQHLLDRAYGLTSNNVLRRATVSRLVYALQPSILNFSNKLPPQDDPHEHVPAHVSGVNALCIDRFEGRYMLSGGASSSIAIWDLEAQTSATEAGETHLPQLAVGKTSDEHKLGITRMIFYPFDSLAFLTSSYDHSVKVYSSETLALSAAFDLDSVVYNIALSPIASHLLVACGTQHPNVRLVDLRSGANTHSLAGHTGAVLSTAWSPTREHILVSGATDGSIRFWDVRRSVGELGVLDLENSTGVSGREAFSSPYGSTQRLAHRGPVNGIVWTESGEHLVTCGHDQRVRVWNTETGANTLANFGPAIKNSGFGPRLPILAPMQDLQTPTDLMFYPNEHEVLTYELFEGTLLRRMRRPQPQELQHASNATHSRNQSNMRNRMTSLVWRAHSVEMYSAHADGSITSWRPRTEEDAELDEEETLEREHVEDQKKRKRDVLDDIYQNLTKRQITMGGTGM